MTKRTDRKKRKTTSQRPLRWLLKLGFRAALVAGLAFLGVVCLFAFVNPPTTFYMYQEGRRVGGVTQEWADWDSVAEIVPRAIVAAEDANFCLHWGFDMGAIRAAIDAGGTRGASTISQQVVKNVFLWQDRTYIRKALEAVITPVVELVWTKRRILEVYMNIAEFDEGVFGVKAAAARYFAVEPSALTPVQAARLAAVLPNPKSRDAGQPSNGLRRRAAAILDGAETIKADGRSACFE